MFIRFLCPTKEKCFSKKNPPGSGKPPEVSGNSELVMEIQTIKSN